MLFRRMTNKLFSGVIWYVVITTTIFVFALLRYRPDLTYQNVKITERSNVISHVAHNLMEAVTKQPEIKPEEEVISYETCKDLDLINKPDETVNNLNKALFCDKEAEKSDVVCRMFLHQIGLEEENTCVRQNDGLGVPKIVYYVIFGPYPFKFWHYISMLSAKKIIKPWGLYVVGDAHPVGYWWKRAMNDIKGLRFVYREQPPTIANNTVTWKHHLSDLVRLQMLMLNGGIYLDTDMIVVNSLDPIRNHDISMGLIENGTGMGNAIILAKRHSPFVKEWYKAYETYDRKQFYKNSLHVPRDMWHKHPETIHMESDKFYRPNWFEADLLFKKNDYPWRKNYAVHVWTNGNPVPKGPEELRTLNTTIGQIFRYILWDDPALPK